MEPDENNTYHGWVPALPGCHTWGETLDETRENVKDAIRAYLASLAEENQPIPEDRGFEYFETVTETEIKQNA